MTGYSASFNEEIPLFYDTWMFITVHPAAPSLVSILRHSQSTPYLLLLLLLLLVVVVVAVVVT